MKRLIFLGIVLLSVGANCVLGVLLFRTRSPAIETSAERSQYKFLSLRIFREDKNDIFINFMPLREALRAYIGKQKEKIGIYFEYLPSGSTIGINDRDEIEMASLAKLPTVMAIYDKIAKKELTKDTVLTVKENQLDKAYGTFWKQGAGATITVENAIEKTLIESDNTTHLMLYDLLNLEDKVQMFSQLDIRIELKDTALYSYISPKSYASILKSLYLATYLSKDDSNDILSIMSQSIFHNEIEAGVDKDVLIAHKTGSLERKEGMDISNDCGIVYVPKRPYILCILIQGEDDKKVVEHMQYLSNMIYAYIKRVN